MTSLVQRSQILANPTFTSISPDTITNDQTSITITGTGFISIPVVEAISTTGVITPADSVTFNNSTSLTCNFTLTTDGTYYIRIENNDGLAVRSSTAVLTVSDAPTELLQRRMTMSKKITFEESLGDSDWGLIIDKNGS